VLAQQNVGGIDTVIAGKLFDDRRNLVAADDVCLVFN
jgi:hypothetical protein